MNLEVICPFCKHGCNWQGRFEEYQQHVENCDFAVSTCEYCKDKLHKNQLSGHSQVCPKSPKECPLSGLGCTMPAASEDKLQQHMEEAKAKHFGMLAKRVQSLEEKVEQREFSEVNSNEFKEKAVKRERVEADGAMPSGRRYDSGIDNSLQSLPPQQPAHRKTQLNTARVQNSREVASSIPPGSERDIQTIIESMVSEDEQDTGGIEEKFNG